MGSHAYSWLVDQYRRVLSRMRLHDYLETHPRFSAAGNGELPRPRWGVERLEDRVLLSAQPWLIAMDDASVGRHLGIELDSGDPATSEDDMVLVRNRDSGQVVASALASAVSSVQVTGTSGDDALAIDATVPSSVLFDGGEGSDTLAGPNRDAAWAIAPADAAATDLAVWSVEELVGGSGRDRLNGPNVTTTWDITGSGQGTANGVRFSGFEDLSGAANSDDTFVFEYGGSISGLVEGGDGGFDSIVVYGGSYQNVVLRPTGPDSGQISLDGVVTGYAGFEPLVVASGTTNITIDLTGITSGTFTLAPDTSTPATNDYKLTEVGGGMESHTFTDPGGGGSVAINMGSGNDTITLSDLNGLAAPLTISGGAGNDTYKFDDHWGNVTIGEGASGGTDTLDFGPFTDTGTNRDWISILPQASGGVDINGKDGSSITLSATSANAIEDLTNANINLTALPGAVGDQLVGGLNKTVSFMRSLAQAGQFATSLPLIGGQAAKNSNVTIGKALGFAESLDELRLQVQSFFAGTVGTITSDDLMARLNSLFQSATRSLSDLGPAILAPLTLSDFAAAAYNSIAASDVYEFNLTLDLSTVNIKVDVNASPTPSVSGNSITVGLGGNTADYTVANLVAAINSAISQVSATAGKVGAVVRNGQIAFQVVDTQANSFSVEGLQAAISKLGFTSGTPILLQNVQDILRSLGDLNLSFGSAMTLGVGFASGTPQLKFGVDYSAQRTSSFFYNLGDQARSLGLAFDLDAKIQTAAQMAFKFDLGLGLSPSGSSFFLDVDTLRAGASANLSAITGLGLNIGFLSATASGSLALDGGVKVDTTTLQNVTNPSTISITPGLLSLTGSNGTGSPSFNLNLAASANAGLGAFTASATLNASGNPFDGSNISITTGGDFTTKIFDFNRLNSAGVVSLVAQLATWLDGVRKGDLIGSINIPFVKGALDSVLDLAAFVKNALLYDDGPDNTTDSSDKLAVDLNAALNSAGLGQQIQVQGNGSSLKLVAIDPAITAFSISAGSGDAGGFAQLGFSGGSASGSPKTISGSTGPLNGILTSGDAVIHFSITRSGVTKTTDVQLKQASTADNKGIGDDVAKLVDANNAPLFKTAQDLAGKLAQIVSAGAIHYDPATKILTYPISFANVPLFSVELPTDFSIDLSPVAQIASNTHLIIDAKGGLSLTLGFDLSETPAGSSALTDTTTLSDLNVEVLGQQAITAPDSARSIVGQLSGDANLNISINGGPTIPLKISKAAGRPGTDINVTMLGGNQAETAIAVNPTNPKNIIVAVNDSNPTDGIFGSVSSNDAVWVTFDGGSTWTRKIIPVPPAATFGSHGDPTVVFSRDGSRVVYAHLVDKNANHGGTGQAHVPTTAVSLDGGATWLQANTSFVGSIAADEDGDGFNDDNDKEFLAVGPDVNNLNQDRYVLVWHRNNIILASTSLDGLVWTNPVRVGNEDSLTPAPASDSGIDSIPAFGPNGEIYVVWEDFKTAGVSKIMFDLSLDGGVTWGGGKDQKVFFDTAEYALTPDDMATLDQFAILLNNNPQYVVEVAGYTDTIGTSASNLTLSQNRAASVANYLIGKGVAASRITQLWFGETRLAVPTGDNVDEPANRRVELTLDQVIYTGNVNVFNDPGSANGPYKIPAQPTRGIWMGLSMDVDRSTGPNRGRIYVGFTDQGDLDGSPDAANPTDHNNTDAFVIASDTQGASWSALGSATPVRINDDGGTNSQFFSWIGVDQSTGNVAISWYDARNDNGVVGPGSTDTTANNDVQYWASYSLDGGKTWLKNMRVSDGTSTASGTGGNDFGDYTALAFVNGTIHMAWTDTSNSTGNNPNGAKSFSDVYFDHIDLNNKTIQDLLDDINAAIAAIPALAGKIQAQADGNIIKLVAIDSSVTSLTVTTTTADPAFTDLGFQQSTSVTRSGSDELSVKAAKSAPAALGQLTADASFSIDLGSGPQTITILRADTVSPFAPNRNILDLVNDVQKAVDAVLGTGKIAVSAAGTRLLFTRVDGNTTTAFTITPGANASELGLSGTLTSDKADMIITDNAGVAHRVSLDGVTNIAGVISAINTQTGGTVTASKTVDDPTTPINEANTGLTLTASGSPTGSFMIAPANGSRAAMQLGILAADKNPNDSTDVADGKIVGAKISGATLLDRFFITSADLSNILNASLDVSAGVVLSNGTIDAKSATDTTLTIDGFDFTKLDSAEVTAGHISIKLKGINGFTAGTYTITQVIDKNTIKVSGDLGAVGQLGASAILQNGVSATANFGFVGVGLSGTADLGAELALGFNTNAPELADNKLTFQELINGLNHILDLLAFPDLRPISPATDFGKVDLGVSLSAGSADFTALAGTLLGSNPKLTIDIITLGDPFLGKRFQQASFTKLTDTSFTLNGDFTTKLPASAKLRFTDGSGDHDLTIASATFDSGANKTTVTITPNPDSPYTLPSSLADVKVILLPDVNITTTGLNALPDFSNFDFAKVLAALQALSGFLGQFEAFGFLNQKLPLVDKSVNDLLSFASSFASSLTAAGNNPAGTLQLVETKIDEAFGINAGQLSSLFNAVKGVNPSLLGLSAAPNDVVDIALATDTATGHRLITFDLTVGTGFSQSLDVSIPGIDFGSALSALGLGNLLDLTGSAGLFAEGGVFLRLKIGVDLSNPTNIFLYDDSGLQASLNIGGKDLAFRVGVGPLALSIASTPTTPSQIQLGATATASISGGFDADHKQPITTALTHLTANLAGTATGTLPVFFPTDSHQIGAIQIGEAAGSGFGNLAHIGSLKLVTSAPPSPAPTTNDFVIDVHNVVDAVSHFDFTKLDLFSNIFLAVDGLDSILGFVGGLMQGQVGSFKIPLVGDQLAKGAHFIDDLRANFIAPLRHGLETAKNAAQDFADPDKNVVSKLLYDLLGPNGINLLKPLAGHNAPDSPNDYIALDTNLDDYLAGGNVALKDLFIAWNVELGSTLVNLNPNIGFDLGIPGLGLKTEGNIGLDVNWQLDLGFGLSAADGFYVDVSSDHELLFDVDVTAPATITGTLGFLGLRAADKGVDFDDGTGSKTYHTGAGLTFKADLFEKNATDANDAKKLSFTELGNLAINTGIAANASAALGLELGLSPELFGQLFGPGAAGVISGFPKITSDFLLLWELGSRASDPGLSLSDRAAQSTFIDLKNVGDSIGDGLKVVEFKGVALDLGSFLSEVLGPIVQQVSKFTKPIQPLIDFVTSPIPIIGQLGLNVTWLDLAQALAGDKVNVGLIKSVAEIIEVINEVAAISGAGEVKLPIGDMVLYSSTAGGSGFKPHLWDSSLDLGNTFNSIKSPGSGLLSDAISSAGGIENALTNLAGSLTGQQQQATNTLKKVVTGTSAGGFNFPFLKDPSQIFGILMGKPADLVTYDLAPLNFEFDFHQFFSIFGPLGVSIGLMVQFQVDTAFGYDTLGIQEFVQSGFKNPGLLFDGFFISASPKLNGVDDPELTFLAELSAAAELNLGIARAGVAAALGFKILFNLFDPNHDMKIRFTELVGNIVNQLHAPSDADKLLAPLAIFDVSGEIYARLFAFLEINFGFFSFEKEFPIFGPATLLSFNVDFFRPPILASEQDATGDLIINTGKFAKQRLLGNATDVAEHLIIQSNGTDGDYVKVQIKSADGALGPDADVFQDYKVKKGSKIIIDGGEGSDIFDLSGFVEGGVLIQADLGNGDDQLLWNNTATGIPSAFNTITGGSGDDTLQGSAGSDLITGGAGNDSITANDGDDLLFGDENDLTDATLRSASLAGADIIRGLLKPGDGADSIDGGGGHDILVGSGGKDSLTGGGGNDILLGGGGAIHFNNADVFKIQPNVMVLTANPVTDTENKAFDATAGDTLDGGANDDLIYGTAGPDSILGGTGQDSLFGGAGFDTIDAGAGNDLVFGDGGLVNSSGPAPTDGGDADIIQGGAGNDTIFGGGGGDTIQGGDGADIIHGNSGPDKIFGDNGTVAPDGTMNTIGGSDGNDTIYGEGEPDKIHGGGGIDQIDGGLGADFIQGGDDPDLIIANKGSDFLDGQDGSDTYLIDYQGGNADSLMTVLDTGNPADVDLFVATGTIFNDNILLRANTDGSIAFVALINNPDHVERINYSFVERIVVNGSFGDDYFAADDTAAEVTLNGEFGNDTFQIGQMFKSPRTEVAANVSVDDVFATIETTRGFLSNGISAPMTINGGVGDDLFVVYHNKAVLQLNGEEGDDTFEVRAFALVGSQEPQRERTDISGGAGADLVQYAVNAPVNIDGGDGFDKVIIIGTEFGDDFVITRDGVFGAGLNVSYVNIESLTVDGAEGDDRFYVLSTSEKFITEIDGGLGSDTFNMSGDTPPIVSNDLRGHSGIITTNVESGDLRYDAQTLYGISAHVADNEEPFAVVRPTGGSTIITEGGVLNDSYTIVLTRQPEKDVLIKALAPIPTPGDRELRALAFRLDSPTKDSLTLDGTGLTLRFTPSNWYIPQTVNIYADLTLLTDIAGLFTRPELGDNGGVLPAPFVMDDNAPEGVRFGVINHIVQAASTILTGTFTSVNNATPSVTITDPGGVTTTDLIGRKVLISDGTGAGQARFVIGAVDNGSTFTLTLDRAYPDTALPNTSSKYIVTIDDAFTGKMSSFDENPSGLPPVTDPNLKRSTFTDSAANFPTSGEGLTGAILEIVGGPGAGQQRLILGNLSGDPTHTLILNGPWSTDPVAGQSIYRIERYAGMSIPSVTVQINDNDQPGLIVDETKGFKDPDGTPDASDVVADIDTTTAVIEAGNGDQLGEQDVVRIRLTSDPGANVEVGLVYDSTQLLLTDLAGNPINTTAGHRLSFSSGNWNIFQNVLVKALADGVREGFHTSLIQFQIFNGSGDVTLSATDTFQTVTPDRPVLYVGLSHVPVAGSVTVTLNGNILTEHTQYEVISNKVLFLSAPDAPLAVSGDIIVSYQYVNAGLASAFTTPVLAKINDADAPTVLVRETDGSTDVIEVKNGGSDPDSIPPAQNTDQAPWTDTYEVVLTALPTANVVVTLAPQITKTTRTGGIRHDAVQVAISSTDPRVTALAGGYLQVTFTSADWDQPVVITVKAIDDTFVDGGDTKVFAPHPSTVSQILGPVTVNGFGGRGSLALDNPLMLPGETNLRTPDGSVVSFTPSLNPGPGAIEQMTVTFADLEAKRIALGLASIDDLIGRTIEMARGNGVDVIIDPSRPREKFDRFWLITAINLDPNNSLNRVLTLQNPSQLDTSTLPASAIPDAASKYAITNLSLNFFVDETTQVDYMFVHDEDSPADSKGVLTSTRLSGLNMGPDLVIGGQSRPGGITYGQLEVLEINLGKGNNDFTVLGTHTRSDGYRTWTFLNTGDETVPWNGVMGDTVTVKLSTTDQITTTGLVSSSANPAIANNFTTTVTIPGTFADGSLAGQLIRILNDGDNAQADGQTRRILGNVGNVLTVDRPWEFLPDGQAFDILNEADGAFAVNAQGGNDTVDASQSSLGIAIFGGLGNDTLTGGSGDDIIFGDRGRVDYFNEIGAIVTRLGDAPAPITGSVTTQVTLATLMTLIDSGAAFPVPDDLVDGFGTDDIGLRGLYVDINNGKGFLQTIKLITNNTATSLTINPGFDPSIDLPGPDGANTSQYRISTRPENQTDGIVRDPTLLITVDNALGGMDVIDAGAGSDQIFGGAAADNIFAGSGDDVVVGDAGRLDRSRDPLAPTDPVIFKSGANNPVIRTYYDRLRTIEFGTGGADTLAGGAGADIMLGGAAGDLMYGDNLGGPAGALDGADTLIGDNGEVKFANGVIKQFFTTYASNDAGGNDSISGNAAADVILGGVGGDTIFGDDATAGTNDGGDIVLGDQGIVRYDVDADLSTLDLVTTTDVNLGASDSISGNAGGDLILGGTGGDDIRGNSGDDIAFGDFAAIAFAGNAPSVLTSIDQTQGGADILRGGDDNDVLVGGPQGDSIDGNEKSDLVFGDNVDLQRRPGVITNPRFQALAGTLMYSRADLDPTVPGDLDGSALIDGVARNYQNPDGTIPFWAEYLITNLYHSLALQLLGQLLGGFGNDYIAGGAGHDQIFGQLGNDTIQGDGSIDYTSSQYNADGTLADPAVGLVSADRGADGLLRLRPSFEAASDGDDYIEGNGGSDVIFGNLGQDDIVGGSSSMFTLTTPDLRPDDSDLIFGGAGADISRNNVGDATVGADGLLTPVANGHSRDADVILGDNGNIQRLVGVNGAIGAGASGIATSAGFLAFNYDVNRPGEPASTVRIIPRTATLLDYTPGGTDFNPASAANDIGAADEIHGESGDDFIYGGKGSDVLYGDGQDDDLIGGTGNDWISGGTGNDGVLGDDGRIYSSRNSSSYGEPLYGISPLLATDPDTRFSNGNVLNELISTPGNMQTATINVADQLKKTVNLTPFSTQPGWTPAGDEFGGSSMHNSDDMIFGGLGDDSLHGGSGDDAISGAEALPLAYTQIEDASFNLIGTARSDFYHPFNPGDALRFNPIDVNGQHANATRAGEFALYDEYDPLRKILLNADGTAYKGTAVGVALEFFLNFNPAEGVSFPAGTAPKGPSYPAVNSDGNDAIFGDLGNDWIVGGTGRDDLFGGFGNDLLNADDNHDSTAGTADPFANNVPDTAPTYEDRAYGGAGRDVLIANTGGDRLIDWVGEFNSYLVPFAPFGAATISRALQPQIPEFLYALSLGQGVDPTRAADTGADPARNGEPEGELGLVLQKDVAWHDQTGGPSDPQAGNLRGGKRDVLRSANFNDGQAQGFAADTGSWSVVNGRYQVAPTVAGGDAVSVFYVDEYIPSYFEMSATINAAKPTGGSDANAYLIFDYQSPTNFKFAGINVSTNKLEIGQRNSVGWMVLRQAAVPGSVKAGQDYAMFLAINGSVATVIINNQTSLSYTFAPRLDADGFRHTLNDGMVGIGARNARGQIDNVVVQRIAPAITLDQTVDFSSGPTTLLQNPAAGTWQSSAGRYLSSAPSGAAAVDLLALSVGSDALLELNTTLATAAQGGFVFDYYAPDDFKFLAISTATQQVLLGHRTARSGWVIDAAWNTTLSSTTDYKLALSLKGTTVSATLNGQAALSYVYNGVVTDGDFGLLARNGQASFDVVNVKTDDVAYESTAANLLSATAVVSSTSAAPLTAEALQPIGNEAIRRWSAALEPGQKRLLKNVTFAIADLPGSVLGQASGHTVLIDVNAAGHGWFVDPTPGDDSEFAASSTPQAAVADQMDLLTVVMHELGHVLGFGHTAIGGNDLMAETLATGERRTPAGADQQSVWPFTRHGRQHRSGINSALFSKRAIVSPSARQTRWHT